MPQRAGLQSLLPAAAMLTAIPFAVFYERGNGAKDWIVLAQEKHDQTVSKAKWEKHDPTVSKAKLEKMKATKAEQMEKAKAAGAEKSEEAKGAAAERWKRQKRRRRKWPPGKQQGKRGRMTPTTTTPCPAKASVSVRRVRSRSRSAAEVEILEAVLKGSARRFL
jgi:hypothetical protein